MLYGEEAYGLPAQALASLRAQMIEAAGESSRRSCKPAQFELLYGRRADPWLRYVGHVILAFYDLFRNADAELRAGIVRRWSSRALRSTNDGALDPGWQTVTGLVSTTVATLADLGWKTSTPYELRSPCGERFRWDLTTLPDEGEGISTKAILADVLTHAGDCLYDRMWIEAAKQPRSSGLEGGVDWTAYRCLARWWRDDRSMLGMLHNVATNSFITPACRWAMYVEGRGAGTVAECNEDEDFLCPHGCGASRHLVTHMHLFWRCPLLPSLQLPEVDKSQNLLRRAEAGVAAGHEGYWLRGCVPKLWTHDLEDEPALTHRCHGRLDIEELRTRLVFTDGSGGKRSSDPRRRRATFGAVVFEALFNPRCPYHSASRRCAKKLFHQGG